MAGLVRAMTVEAVRVSRPVVELATTGIRHSQDHLLFLQALTSSSPAVAL
jgi:hypothetical protein